MTVTATKTTHQDPSKLDLEGRFDQARRLFDSIANAVSDLSSSLDFGDAPDEVEDAATGAGFIVDHDMKAVMGELEQALDDLRSRIEELDDDEEQDEDEDEEDEEDTNQVVSETEQVSV